MTQEGGGTAWYICWDLGPELRQQAILTSDKLAEQGKREREREDSPRFPVPSRRRGLGEDPTC